MKGFFNSGVICDILRVPGKTADFRNRLTILVKGVSSTSTDSHMILIDWWVLDPTHMSWLEMSKLIFFPPLR